MTESKTSSDAVAIAQKQLAKARARSSSTREGVTLSVWVVEELLRSSGQGMGA